MKASHHHMHKERNSAAITNLLNKMMVIKTYNSIIPWKIFLLLCLWWVTTPLSHAFVGTITKSTTAATTRIPVWAGNMLSNHRSNPAGARFRLSSSSSTDNGKEDLNLDANEALRNIPPPEGFSKDEAPIPLVPEAYLISGAATIIAWTVVAAKVLSWHPDAQFANLTPLHNALTMAQALAFPVPVLAGVVWTLQKAKGWKQLEQAPWRRLNLAYLTLSAWLAVVVRQYSSFAFGYDLIPGGWGKRLSLIHMVAGGIGWGVWKASVRANEIYETPIFRLLRGVLASVWDIAPSSSSRAALDDPIDDDTNDKSALYATATVGFAVFTILPLVAPYPLATLPSLLGKRLCRPAAGFYALATAVAFVLKKASEQGRLHEFTSLRRGLWVGSTAHVTLVLLKVAGIDGGGWWFPGEVGLAQNYPALCRVPVTAALSLLAHVAVMFTGWPTTGTSGNNDQTRSTVVEAEVA
eukprot:scaffold1690_cov182-Amphora_coffeaeformis.AAC.7